MKVKIKHPGAHLQSGKELRELEVGEVIEIQGDALPNFLIGKAEIIGDNEGKSLVTNDELLESAMAENKGLTELLDGVRAELKSALDAADSAKSENEKLSAEISDLKKQKSGK